MFIVSNLFLNLKTCELKRTEFNRPVILKAYHTTGSVPFFMEKAKLG